MQAGDTALSVAKKKGNKKVCEELESKKQPTVKSISTQQLIVVSSALHKSYNC